jgi:hypothetical protein
VKADLERDRVRFMDNNSFIVPDALCPNAYDVPRDRMMTELQSLRSAFQTAVEVPNRRMRRSQDEEGLLCRSWGKS